MAAVSVVLPTYNRAYILGNAIQSMLRQTHADWELLIVDDGSTDTTGELVKSFNDERIKYFYQEHQNHIIARNKALELAEGKWIAYLDSDNEFYPSYLEVMLREVTAHPGTVWAFPRVKTLRELWLQEKLVAQEDITHERCPESVTVQDIFYRNMHPDLNGFMHSRAVVEAGIRFDENLPRMQDWDFILTIGERFPEGLLYVKEFLLEYHQRYGGDGAVSNTGYRQWVTLFDYIYQKHKDDRMMQGQSWYPDRIKKWGKLADDFDKGLIPPYHLWYFKEHWPSQYKQHE